MALQYQYFLNNLIIENSNNFWNGIRCLEEYRGNFLFYRLFNPFPSLKKDCSREFLLQYDIEYCWLFTRRQLTQELQGLSAVTPRPPFKTYPPLLRLTFYLILPLPPYNHNIPLLQNKQYIYFILNNKLNNILFILKY